MRRRSCSLGGVAVGAGGVLLGRALLGRVLLFELRRAVRALNAGNPQPLLSRYVSDAVLHFNEGDHRWAGEHRGREAIGRFLQSFMDAGLQGEIVEAFFSGPPWRMTILTRFDDQALDPAGEQIYHNRTLLLARARWGRIVWQEDFYEDTERIGVLEARLREREDA